MYYNYLSNIQLLMWLLCHIGLILRYWWEYIFNDYNNKTLFVMQYFTCSSNCAFNAFIFKIF